MVYQYGMWLTYSPSWAYTTICLFIHQLMDTIWMVYSLWLLWVMLLWTLFFHGLNIFSFYGYIQKECNFWIIWLLYINFWGTDKEKWLYHFTALTSTIYEGAFSPHPLQHLLLLLFLITANLMGRRRQWHPTPVLLPGKSHGWRSLVGYSPWGR